MLSINYAYYMQQEEWSVRAYHWWNYNDMGNLVLVPTYPPQMADKLA
jgi:hypothetical protein